jgi:hypothetical protein
MEETSARVLARAVRNTLSRVSTWGQTGDLVGGPGDNGCTPVSRSASLLELQVLEDTDSIQVALMQVMRLILRRQLDHKTAGLLLYGLQTASANLRRIDFEHHHKPDVIIDSRTVGENGVGQEAWYPEDFEEEGRVVCRRGTAQTRARGCVTRMSLFFPGYG